MFQSWQIPFAALPLTLHVQTAVACGVCLIRYWVISNTIFGLMNLPQEERILIKDIFNVRVTHETGSDCVLLQQFPKEIAGLGDSVSLIEHSAYFDSLLMERLQIQGTDILSYLEECLEKCFYIEDKPWNQSAVAQQFIRYSKEILRNFIYLSQINPEIFPQQLQIDSESVKLSDRTVALARRVTTHFERRGFNDRILDALVPKVDEDLHGNFVEALLEVLIARTRFQTIIDSKAFFYLTLLESFLQRPEFKATFMKLQRCPFLPMEFGKVRGSMLDTQSPLGIFLRPSILGTSVGSFYQQVEARKRYESKVIDELGREKFGRDKVKYYTDLQSEFYGKYTDICKLLLRKETQKQFFEWNYAAIVSNLKRAKLGSRLQGALNTDLSHDGLMINLYMCLLNLCRPILSLDSDKHRSINPEFYVHNKHIRACKYEPINKNQPPKAGPQTAEFGTITEFFFLAWEFLHIGAIPTYDNFIECLDKKDKLEKMKEKIVPGHPMHADFTRELAKVKTNSVVYYLVLMDDNLIKLTVKLFDLLLHLLPKWLQIDYELLCDCRFGRKYRPTPLTYFLPEHLLDSLYRFHYSVYRFKQNYIGMLGEDHIHRLLNLICLVLSEEEICSNPYVGANFVELLFFFQYERKSGAMSEVFRTNGVAHKNLTLGLIRFYSDIAVTGSSNQFYEKFKYRQYVNKIFTSIWVHQVYRDNLKNYFKTQNFERFLNMVMSDTTYCFDETNENYGHYKELENKSQQGKLSEEDKKNEEQLSQQMQATLHHSTSNLRLIKELSKWSPHTFFHEAFLGDTVLLLNNILHTFIDPTSFVSNRQLLLKYRFEKETVLSNLIQIYVNLHISEKFPSEIVKDTRFYRKEYFAKALQKASNEHQTDIETLERFEQLISILQTQVNEDELDDQIFGEIPDKYLCSLMSTVHLAISQLMKDPVRLPSGYVVDRVYIHKHVLNDERDPFTRAPLKSNEWEEVQSLKDEIAVWKKRRLEELKGANKSVKYGNIGKNAKEEEKESLYDNRKISLSQEQDEDEEAK